MMSEQNPPIRTLNVRAFIAATLPDGNVLYANDWACALSALVPEQVVGKPICEAGWFANLPSARQRVVEAIEQAATANTVRREIDVYVAGGRQPFEFTFVPEFDDNGNVASIIVSGIDVAIREQTDSEKNLKFLNELGEATRELTNPSKIMEVTSRMLGRHLQASRAAYADVEDDNDSFTIQHDYTDGCDSTVGQYSLALFGPQAVASMRGGETLVLHNVPNEISPGSGRETFASIDIAAIVCCPLVRYGNLVAMMAVHHTSPRDWTDHEIALVQDVVERSWSSIERARAQHRLLKKERQFEDLFEFAPDAMVMVNLDGDITLVNQRAENLFGYLRHELIGEKVERLVPVDMQAHHVGLRAGFSQNSGHEPFVNSDPDLRGMRKDGSQFPAEISLSPIETEQGPMVAASVRDTTERSRLESQLQQSLKMETVGQLAGGVAHDFNNLLTVINATVELLIERVEPDDDMRDDFSTILRAGEQAATLTRQLLALSRQQVLNPVLINLNDRLKDMEPMLQRMIGETIAVKFRPTTESVTARVDRTQFDQVLLNLALNSRDAMPNGGTLILETSTVALDDARLAVETSLNPRSHVVLSVSDTGTGMDEATRRKVFEPFFTTKPAGQGTGLGLSTAYGIVQQSGGHISVSSEVGKGTTFRVYFPRVHVEAAAKQQLMEERVRGNETILVVEDELEIMQVARIMLERRGYTVATASSGHAAIQLMSERGNDIDVILSDVVMPDISGPEAVREIRKSFPAIKVLYMSGYAADLIARHGIDEDPRHFLAKPFTLAELSRSVRDALDN